MASTTLRFVCLRQPCKPRLLSALQHFCMKQEISGGTHGGHRVLTIRTKTWKRETSTAGAKQYSSTSPASRVAVAQSDPMLMETSTISHSNESIVVQFQSSIDGESKEEKYPFLWLRDSCLCEDCHLTSSKSRSLLLKDLNPHTKPTHVKVSPSGEDLSVTWDDGHRSTFSANFLWNRSFRRNTKRQSAREEFYQLPRKFWSKDHEIKSFDFGSVLNDDNTQLEFLTTMETDGIALCSNTPRETGQIEKIAQRIAYLRLTGYGDTFTVEAKPNPSNLAYTGKALGLHTDLTFMKLQPGLQFLHYICQPKGTSGRNQFADGIHAAQILREQDPEAFHLLSTQSVDYYDWGEDAYKFHMIQRRPVIELSASGDRIEEIHFNNQLRDYQIGELTLEDVNRFYRAMIRYNDILYQNAINIKMEEGSIVCFDNLRVLHGRTEYPSSEGYRFLEGAYVDWCEVRSRRRVLQEKLGVVPPPIF